jgi:hypothetical protein
MQIGSSIPLTRASTPVTSERSFNYREHIRSLNERNLANLEKTRAASAIAPASCASTPAILTPHNIDLFGTPQVGSPISGNTPNNNPSIDDIKIKSPSNLFGSFPHVGSHIFGNMPNSNPSIDDIKIKSPSQLFGRPEISMNGILHNSYYGNSSTKSISQNFEMYCENLNPSRVNEIVDFNNGNLALHYAIIFNNQKCIDTLLQKGANEMLKNKDNESAYDCAVKHNNSYFFYKIKDINIQNFNFIKETTENLKKQIVALDVKNNNLNIIVKDMELRESLLQVQVNELNEKINDNEKNISILTKNNNSLYKDNQTISNLFNSLKNKNDESELSNNYDHLLSENKEQLIIISNLTKENDNFSNNISELKKENDTLLHENNSIKHRIDNLEELLQQNKKRRLDQ